MTKVATEAVERIESAIRKHIPGAVDSDFLINRNHNHAEKRYIASLLARTCRAQKSAAPAGRPLDCRVRHGGLTWRIEDADQRETCALGKTATRTDAVPA